MANKTADGGSAFPWNGGDPRDGSEGMSLRDYFAGQALTGLIINAGSVHPDVPLSMRAYEVADAMLAERAK